MSYHRSLFNLLEEKELGGLKHKESMNTKKLTAVKRTYISPQIVRIKLDNEISLTLGSTEAADPMTEPIVKSPEYFNNFPFKSYMS